MLATAANCRHDASSFAAALQLYVMHMQIKINVLACSTQTRLVTSLEAAQRWCSDGMHSLLPL